jgi:Fe-S-cluster containining protein
VETLEAELERARDLSIVAIADAIEAIGFECTRCGACCKAADGCGGSGTAGAEGDGQDHTATVFPDEIRRLQARAGEDDQQYDWRDVARPMPYGLTAGEDGLEGETFEWALATDDCGDCAFYEESGGVGACTVHADRPLVCRTYPFSVALGGTSQPMGDPVDDHGVVRAHECEGLGREISRDDAEDLARALKRRAIRDIEEAIGVRDGYEPADPDPGEIVVHDSEGAKRPDGRPLESGGAQE